MHIGNIEAWDIREAHIGACRVKGQWGVEVA